MHQRCYAPLGENSVIKKRELLDSSLPDFLAGSILHSGPPITWDRMCGAMRGAVTGAIVFEGLAKDIEEAEKVAASGEITFSPCHEHDCVGSMAGVTSASMLSLWPLHSHFGYTQSNFPVYS